MKQSYQKLIDGNKLFSDNKKKEDPAFFENLAKGQSPEYLWIGCSDSRVPANEITGTKSGEIFVHRNIANMVVNTDMNLLSVLEYSVVYLKVKHIIVCGHYGCGGVKCAMSNQQFGLVDNWLSNIKNVYNKYRSELDPIPDENDRVNKLAEYNVIEQVKNVAKTTIVQNAWKERELHLHGWIYGLNEGLIKDLNVIYDGSGDLSESFRYA
jgi:carbonic anhydrase